MLVGLIFREKVKPRRSFTAWKERAKDVLPAPVTAGAGKGLEAARAFGFKPPHVVEDFFNGPIRPEHTGDSGISRSTTTTSKSGLGFGRQAEKAAAETEGSRVLLTRHLGQLPKYTPETSGSSAPTFQSSTTAV